MRLRAQGLDNVMIGERLRRTPDAVRRRLNWIKLSTEERREVNANRGDRRHRLLKREARV